MDKAVSNRSILWMMRAKADGQKGDYQTYHRLVGSKQWGFKTEYENKTNKWKK